MFGFDLLIIGLVRIFIEFVALRAAIETKSVTVVNEYRNRSRVEFFVRFFLVLFCVIQRELDLIWRVLNLGVDPLKSMLLQRKFLFFCFCLVLRSNDIL